MPGKGEAGTSSGDFKDPGKSLLLLTCFRYLKFLKDKTFRYTRRAKAHGANIPGRKTQWLQLTLNSK